MLLRTAENDDYDQRPITPFVFPQQSGSKLIRSSAMRGSGAPTIELNNASVDHVRKLLQQLLADAAIEQAPAWEKALIPILLQCTNDVEPDVQRGDDMDIRHYIKLKKIPGGRPGDTFRARRGSRAACPDRSAARPARAGAIRLLKEPNTS